MEYDPATGAFVPDGRGSLVHAREVDAAYGWITGFGELPAPHFDVLVLTNAQPAAGHDRRAKSGAVCVGGGLAAPGCGVPRCLVGSGALRAHGWLKTELPVGR